MTGDASRDADRVARAGLSLAVEPVRQVVRAIAAVGAAAVWRATGNTDDDAVRLLDASAAAGVRFVVPGDPEWPPQLAGLAPYTAVPAAQQAIDAGRHLGVPFGLWIRGRELPPTRSIAVVGARAATPYGLQVASELAAGLAERGQCVVSGAAFGIDAAAHRGALALDGHTVAVLACGLDLSYPKGHEALIAKIAETGTVVSERPFGTTVRRAAFLHRNRLIAALSLGTVLVEAGQRSGARNTLGHAQHLQLARFVVPGPVTSALSAGCHAWLREDDEAQLVTSAADVLEHVGDAADLGPLPAGPRDVRDGLRGAAVALLEALPARGSWPLARIAASVGVGTTEALGIVSALATAGLVAEVDGGYRLTALGRQPTSRVS